MKDLIIFGAGKIAECAKYYLEREGTRRVVAFVCDRAFITQTEYLGCPIIPFEEMEQHFPPDRADIFLALGYHRANALRRQKYAEIKAKGYHFVSYVSPFVHGKFTVGENSLVLDDAIIQPFVSLGNDVFVWGGALVGHHAKIGDHCWITGGCCIGGLSELSEGCFVGLNATIGQSVKVGSHCILGANSLVTKDVPDGSVIVVRDTESHRLTTDHFLKLSSCF